MKDKFWNKNQKKAVKIVYALMHAHKILRTVLLVFLTAQLLNINK